MKKCEWCGRLFDPEEAEIEFENEEGALFQYSNIQKCLCGACAVQAIEDMVDGVYFERCENCGKEFDYAEDSGRFAEQHGPEDASLLDCWGLGKRLILCCDCALDAEDELFPRML